jgi:hypothetical protein
MNHTRGAVADDLTALACPHGVDWSRAPACVAEIENVGCAGDLVTLIALANCRSEALCKE